MRRTVRLALLLTSFSKVMFVTQSAVEAEHHLQLFFGILSSWHHESALTVVVGMSPAGWVHMSLAVVLEDTYTVVGEGHIVAQAEHMAEGAGHNAVEWELHTEDTEAPGVCIGRSVLVFWVSQ